MKIAFLAVLFNLGFALIVAAQSQKELTGTFEIACKVFNYNFKKSAAGLYSFRLEDPEKETVLSFSNADSLKGLQKLLTSVITHLPDSLTSKGITNATQKQQLTDSITHIANSLNSIAGEILADSATLDYLYAKKDSVNKLISYAKAVKLKEYYRDSSQAYGSLSFLEKLSAAVKSARDIVESKTYMMNSFEEESFKRIIINLLTKRKLLFWQECLPGNDSLEIAKRANALFFEIKSRFDFNDDEPPTAKLKLKSLYLNCYYTKDGMLRGHTGKLIKDRFKIEDVTVEFEDGTIKNIFADLSVDAKNTNGGFDLPIRFKNVYPISISSRTDPDMFEKIKIYAGRIKDLSSYFTIDPIVGTKELKLNYNPQKQTKDTSGQIYFYLSDLMEYYVVADNDREDYSPANTVVHLNKGIQAVDLKKERRSKILTARAFSDFIGLQNDEPNGLLQFEIFKKISFNTNTHGGRLAYFDYFSYAQPVLAFTKIEKNLNALELSYADIDSAKLKAGKRAFKARPIDVYQFQKSSFDINLNVVKLNFPELKSNLQVNLNVGIMKTNFADTISVSGPNTAIKSTAPNVEVAHTLRYGSTVIWEIKPENRYSASIGWDYRRMNLLSENYSFSVARKPLINTFWFDGFMKTNDDNKLFFRVRLSYDDKFSKQNFVQMQLGYLLNLFKTDK